MISNLSPREEHRLFGSLSESTQIDLIERDESRASLIKPSETDAFCIVAQEGFLSEHINRIGRLKAERMGEATRKQIDKIIEDLEQLEYQMVQDDAYRREELQKVEDSMS